MNFSIESERFYQGAIITGLLSIICFVAFLILPKSIGRLFVFVGFGGVFFVLAILFFYLGNKVNKKIGLVG